jgi:very-short-patch-repair endonuclease
LLVRLKDLKYLMKPHIRIDDANIHLRDVPVRREMLDLLLEQPGAVKKKGPVNRLPRDAEIGVRSDVRKALTLCESPIEMRLLFAMGDTLPPRIKIAAQVLIGPYRADFVLTGRGVKLVIEADGQPWHSTDAQIAHDDRRDAFMRERGFKVLRFKGAAIYNTMPWCLQVISDAVSGKICEKRDER